MDFKILIVDDTPENIDVLGSVLNEYKKFVALNGEKALKLAESKLPDLILLDIMMPGMDGFEVCQRLKENPVTQNIPVIFITAKNSIEDETKGLELGAVDFISKPISPPSVLARVKNHLELQQSRKVLADQNDKLTELNEHILESISYAKFIQKAVLPWKQQINHFFKNNFILFKPQEIISGDYYWYKETGDDIWIAACDCTGHGVPGSMLSLIGTKLMDEGVLNKGIKSPAELLEFMDQKFTEFLNKDVEENRLWDTIDVCLVKYERNFNRIVFSGAKRPLFLVDKEINEIKGTKRSIGDFLNKKYDFTDNEIQLQRNTILYLTSDGYQDQLDENGKKIGSKRLKNELFQVSDKDFDKQLEYFSNELVKFQKVEDQRDDITIIGIEINV